MKDPAAKALSAGFLWLFFWCTAAAALNFSGPKYTDPAKTIRVKVGQEFGLLLESNPTTGYQWQLAEQPDLDVVTLVINEYQGAESDRLGAGGHELWIFQATGPGQAVIKLAYLRPWEKDKKPSQTVKYTVLVKDAAPTPGGRLLPDEAKTIIADKAQAVIAALKNKDFVKLAGFFHPAKGVRFSPYAYININRDVVLKSDQVAPLITSGQVKTWGKYDGSGLPIELSLAGYYRQFIYSGDFASATQVGYNQFLGRSNIANNIFAVYPEAITVEYYLPGPKTEDRDFAWQSLRLIFEKSEAGWYLVGISHDGWTI